ncbi:putative oligoketide cyclase/dehydratase or lipid transport protein YfjG [Vibrio astriarenae]|nr:putative oligoketide cyclase/dehydratase or lipid transport protein YfjG [Vibrio sp. C7]
MKQVSRSALVSFSAEQMYDLVNDVSNYPEFLPGCAALKCWSRGMPQWWHRSM